MTWKRGFFRLWILFSLLWFGVSLMFFGKDDFKAIWQPSVKIKVEYERGTVSVLDGALPTEELRRKIIEEILRDGYPLISAGDINAAQKQIATANQTADEFLNVIRKESKARQDRLQYALMTLLVPPGALFFLGTMIGWVARGFRLQRK